VQHLSLVALKYYCFQTLLILQCWVFGSHQAPAQSYAVDVSKSTISWTGWKQLFGKTVNQKGILRLKSGAVYVKDGKFVNALLMMDMTSIAHLNDGKIYTDNDVVTHLKSESCFFVEKYPEAVFRLKAVETRTSGNDSSAAMVTGTLTIKGITKTLSFPAKITRTAQSLVIAVAFQVSRKAYSLDLEPFLIRIGGDKMVRDNIDIEVEIRAEVLP
jgi:polyisoprenoid-binding protein YceI